MAILEIIVPHPDFTQVKKPLAMAIDIGSSSVRAVVFDANAQQIMNSEHRERYRLEITPDGGSMCDPHRIRRLVAKCVRKSAGKLGSNLGDVATVGVSCHWHSLMGLNRHGEPVTPLYMWSDKRASADAEILAAEVDEHATHQRTGCRIHSSYWPAKLRWLKRTHANTYPEVATWCGLSDWLMLADGAPITTSLSMASGTGMLNTGSREWDLDMLASTGLEISQLPPIVDRTIAIPGEQVHPDLVPHGLNAAWYPAIGDGAAANVGAGAVGPDRIALTIGTSGAIRVVRPLSEPAELPPALFRYLLDAETEVIGGALSNGGNMMSWLSGITGEKDQKVAMMASANLAPDSHGLTVLPFFAGERAPSWQDSVAGTITGMTLDTTALHLHRALLETTSLRFATVYDAIKPFLLSNHDIVASGGALLQSPTWMQITADALGHNIRGLPTRTEASARGAAITALQAAGHLPSIRARLDVRRQYDPVPAHTEIYRLARKRQDALEGALSRWKKEVQ